MASSSSLILFRFPDERLGTDSYPERSGSTSEGSEGHSWESLEPLLNTCSQVRFKMTITAGIIAVIQPSHCVTENLTP